jgi:hypothetical protein
MRKTKFTWAMHQRTGPQENLFDLSKDEIEWFKDIVEVSGL